ncbi:PhzF family phenazine biosynthesis protein [Nonomuraea endophytica]|uniref:PhzF family phenazine biosynthesis protein n=1 Tax=Nonomuraea endophytica TaxID=714136 RepID=A0A7W8AHI7_9ACTN|nr:PhzF family phenazine biosynthesis protein [Nonomuraea endophytica]MBB5085221.1 PhzF family phenazine biosynthesis protein [Nonomuraea endophytica]
MRVYTVDAFTDVAFRGNPAAVCLLESSAPAAWMQAVAAEIGLSETAFLLDNSLRWFTPAVEVSLCGHATLATAHVLFSTGAASGQLQFETASGILSVNRTTDGMITMDFPAKEVTPTTPPDGLAKALGVVPVQVSTAKDDLLVELESEEQVRTLSPDITALSHLEARAVIVTARGVSTDFVSRFFAPKGGVPEDPVTGSAHCALAPYWAPRLSRTTMTAAQLSKRGGRIHVTLRGPRVDLAGHAITITSGHLHI